MAGAAAARGAGEEEEAAMVAGAAAARGAGEEAEAATVAGAAGAREAAEEEGWAAAAVDLGMLAAGHTCYGTAADWLPGSRLERMPRLHAHGRVLGSVPAPEHYSTSCSVLRIVSGG